MRSLISFPIIPLVSLGWVDGQAPTPTQKIPLPQAIYSPPPIYRPEWAKQSITGRGIVLVTIDPKTGMLPERECIKVQGANYSTALL